MIAPFDPNHQYLSGLNNLTAAITNIRLYSKEHPQVQRYIKKAYDAIINILNNKSDLSFILIGEEIVADNTPLKTKTPHIAQFQRLLKENGIERLSFKKGLTYAELQHFINELASPETTSIKSRPAIRLGKVELYNHNAPSTFDSDKSTPPYQIPPNLMEKLNQLRQLPLENIQELYFDIKRQKSVNVRGIDEIVNSFLKGFSHGLKPLQMLASLKSADQYTFTHAVNVCLLTMAQAEQLGISGRKLYDVGIAAVLHDVGKLFVPDDILNKPGVLTKDERVIVEAHSVSGARYILKLTEVPQLAILGALEHHIRYDGSGYPHINSKWHPHLISQMIAIADIFDAMRSRRPYQAPKPETLILNILKKEKGTSFNPFLVDNFLMLLQRTPQFLQNQTMILQSPSQPDQKHIPHTSGS
ncbi:MAG: HD domain-containing protein [Desulfobacteraceae bacterium]|jgi:HD-GYP domain-containing protein (c-di-GMP phosphodiesterase class II)